MSLNRRYIKDRRGPLQQSEGQHTLEMQRWSGLFVLIAASIVAAQESTTTQKPAPNTRFGPGAGGFPGGGGFGNPGFGNPGLGSPGLGNPGFGNPGLGNLGFGNPSFPQGQITPFVPGVASPGLINPGWVSPQQPLVSPLRPNCRFFKRDQYGRYVCDVDQKPFECPPVRFECPRFGLPTFLPPQQCFNDNDCANNDKCCPDVCFDHLICKGPE
ncbi:hypothetical protein SK128_005851 [Halocaridina rubra]|uniref:WAP domain-containing protein n=1 Tax=Halocaridina rubra TaxID=373956 RepID=A0AAN9ABC1_HALRR